MAENQDIFGIDEAKETKDSASIHKPGIHRNMQLIGVEIKTLESKAGDAFTVTSLSFQNNEGVKFETSVFRPPASESECKPYTKDVWKNNKKTGEKEIVPASKVFKSRNQDYLYLLVQLGMAVSKSTWVQVIAKLKDSTNTYESLTNAFIKHFGPANKLSNIDIKLMWDNNTKNKSSFLKLAKAGEYNKIFAQYLADKPSFLTVSESELKNGMNRMFLPAAPATKEDGSENSEETTPEEHFDENNITSDASDVADIF